MVVIKRNGKLQDFDSSKITEAIRKAFVDIYGDARTQEEYDDLIESITNDVSDEFDGIDKVDIEELQDAIENELMSYEQFDVAKEYIRYRYLHELRRQHRNDTEMLTLIGGDNEYWNTENSNKNATWVTTQRDYLAGIVSKDLARTYLFPEGAVEAHDQGIIHIHDLDYAIQPMSNCSLVNLEDMLQNGTVINGVKIEKPHKILTAMTIATQIVASVSSSQYGLTE